MLVVIWLDFLFGVTGEQFFKKESSNQIKINEVSLEIIVSNLKMLKILK